jgi:hypothetical protein
MQGQPITELNEGLAQLKRELLTDEMAAKRVVVAIIGFGPVQVPTPFVSPDALTAPNPVANGDTPEGCCDPACRHRYAPSNEIKIVGVTAFTLDPRLFGS